MSKSDRDRPEVDEFMEVIENHMDLQVEERNLIHEMAHNLYNQAYAKGKKAND